MRILAVFLIPVFPYPAISMMTGTAIEMQRLLAESWRSVRRNGVVTAVALYSHNLDFNMTPFVRKQIDLRTSYASASTDYIRAFKLLSEGKVNPKDLISTYPLENAEEGFKDSENLKVMKAMLICKD